MCRGRRCFVRSSLTTRRWAILAGPYALETMLRVQFLQQWYALSDLVMEEALYDTPVIRQGAPSRPRKHRA